MEKTNKDIIFNYLLLIIVFCFLCSFFCVFHPITVLDSDDWVYLSYLRLPIPVLHYWNPSRILPEVLMPACGYLAAFISHLFELNYIKTVTYIFGIATSIFITAYIFEFYMLLTDKYSVSRCNSFFLAIVFFFLHFLLLKRTNSEYQYMFWSYDATCFFFYTIPAVFCCTLVLFLRREKNLGRCGYAFLIISLYFAAFSNLFGSIILVSYVFSTELICIIKNRHIHSIVSYVFILFWLIALVFEMFGGRAGGAVSAGIKIESIKETLRNYFHIFSLFNTVIICCVIVLFILIVFSVFHKKSIHFNAAKANILVYASSFLIASIFLVALCSVVNPDYIMRPQVYIGFVFPLLLIIASILSALIVESNITTVLLAGVSAICFILFAVNIGSFAEINTLGIPATKCISIDNDLVNQMIEADASGKDEIVLEVMDTGYDDNWPHSTVIGNNLSTTLYRHRVTSKKLSVSVLWSQEFNERHNLSFDKKSENRFYE